MTARQVLAARVKELAADDSQMVTAKKSGVHQKTISNLTRADSPDVKHSSTVATVEKVAHAFGRHPWQLLLDQEDVGEQIFEMLMALRRKKQVNNNIEESPKVRKSKPPGRPKRAIGNDNSSAE